MNSILQQIIDKSRQATAGGAAAISHGELIAAALALDRPEWLADMGLTLADAIDRLGPDWLAQIPAAARQLQSEQRQVSQMLDRASNAAAAEALLDAPEVELAGELVTYGHAPGYRDVDLVFNVRRLTSGGRQRPTRLMLRLRPADGEPVARHVRDVHRSAWGRPGELPLDASADEGRPLWIDRL
ncbi:hypothetical protein [Pseudoxanthomonas kaohsiungensis]|uniref:Half a barrel domain-containing protein n=1 Tax=Pseudoxanthomonas kaohsiungensis TaxID=283923 RepID=A0ABW3LZA3_9GAMM|nr:hypothetical protein [Pseudoxanthomonas kaohsiungensis]KAF1702850.1 hypothetical protein CSC66_08745 [Pseudoxanthomonas kaohsiungensis]